MFEYNGDKYQITHNKVDDDLRMKLLKIKKDDMQRLLLNIATVKVSSFLRKKTKTAA